MWILLNPNNVLSPSKARKMSLEDIERMVLHMRDIDPTNAEIVKALNTHGPRNLSLIAKKLKLPSSTVRARFSKLMNNGRFWIEALPNRSKLGLSPMIAILECHPNRMQQLQSIVENLGYWIYIARCYGKFQGLHAILAFPTGHRENAEAYFEEAQKSGAISKAQLIWITELLMAYPNFQWFDFKKKAWNFQWQTWIEEVLDTSSYKLPSGFMTSETNIAEVDEEDLEILYEVCKNAQVGFAELAKKLGMTPQAVRYRYYNHIVERGLIKRYYVWLFPYHPNMADYCGFVIHFEDESYLRKFASSLADKPFSIYYTKALKENFVLMYTYTPKNEFPNLIDTLNILVKENFIQAYHYFLLDHAFKHQSIPLSLFRDGMWVYQHEKLMEKLWKLRPT